MVARLKEHHAIQGSELPVRIAPRAVDLAQVPKQADEHLAVALRRQHRALELRAAAGDGLHARGAVALAKVDLAGEGVDVGARVGQPDEEMAGEPNPVNRQTELARDLD